MRISHKIRGFIEQADAMVLTDYRRFESTGEFEPHPHPLLDMTVEMRVADYEVEAAGLEFILIESPVYDQPMWFVAQAHGGWEVDLVDEETVLTLTSDAEMYSFEVAK